MEVLIDAAIPIVTILMMLAVGHTLTPTDLRRSATDLRALVTASLGQLILLPLIATVIVLVMHPSPMVIAGLILVAACPGGTISNFYAYLSRANTALSISLTVISCLMSFITIPTLVTAGFFFWLDDQPDIKVPFAPLMVQLLVFVAAPTCIGMALRRWRPASTTGRDLLLRRLSLCGLVALATWIVLGQREALLVSAGELTLVSLLFTCMAMAAGYGLAWATGRSVADRLTYVIEFPCRNLVLALMVAVTTLGRPDFVTFAAVLLLVQAVIMLGMTLALGRTETHPPVSSES
jgi:BASS family bile acid:Na+ symporter